jgi:hypothetical protein
MLTRDAYEGVLVVMPLKISRLICFGGGVLGRDENVGGTTVIAKKPSTRGVK